MTDAAPRSQSHDDALTASLWTPVGDLLQDGLLLVDGEGRIRRANPSATDLLGLADQASGARMLGAYVYTKPSDRSHPLARALRGARAGSFELPVRASSGQWVHARLELRPASTENGSTLSWVLLRRVAAPGPSCEADNRSEKQDLLHQATHDELTGLLNRRCLRQTLDREFGRARRYGGDLALIMIDLDYFKVLNDTHGHLVGDAVLRTTAELVTGCLRDTDLAARYGGEEFCVLLPNTELSGGLVLAERIRRTIEGHGYGDGRRGVRVTASLGVAAMDAFAATPDDLVDRADKALYEAKAKGRNLVHARPSGGQSACVVLSADASGVQQANADIVELCRVQRDNALDRLAETVAGMEHREGHDGSHSRQVARLAEAMAGALGLSDHDLADIRGAALLHDIGKVAIPDRVLRCRGELAPAQWRVLRQYPIMGEQILRRVKNLDREALLVRFHNEWFDGAHSHQPLRREALPLGSRVIAVAEAFRAMVSDRPYRARLSMQAAIRQLVSQAGTRFDPHLVNVLVHLVGQKHLAASMAPGLRLFDPAAKSA